MTSDGGLGAPGESIHPVTYHAREDDKADRDFILTCYEVLLGREAESQDVFRDRAGWPKPEVIRSFVASDEFVEEVLPALQTGYPFIGDRYRSSPTLRQRLWASDHLMTSAEAAERIQGSRSWRNLLTCILTDPQFITIVGVSFDIAQ